ncbi:T9SS type A sorting domain-containing protein [Tunicatimonas pelagia]|uniref:T9SS type A sorting domain-containing protein n=1 Tax=Tunicatimonas pelagia TaxID=931531 RepID=UPI002665C350|nr:T9SS type A sorting domain-containing protein [Tunicatimonas pelagia]WKN44576.1 kelch repeat-containing protein [Tunicatimonas pelagia]
MVFRTNFLLAALVLLLTNTVLIAQNEWVESDMFPGSGRFGAISFVIDGKGYIGLGSGESGLLVDFWRYDPASGTWEQVADFAGAGRRGAVAFVLDGKAYVGLGTSGTFPNTKREKDFWVYDPTLNTWSATTDFAGTARSYAVAFVQDNQGFVLTGQDDTGYPTDVWAFDASTQQWKSKNAFTRAARSGAFVFSVNDTVYIGGGTSRSGFTTQLQNHYLFYEAASDTWSTTTILPSGMTQGGNHSYFAYQNKGYVVTGNEVWQFDPAQDEWDEVDNIGSDISGEATFAIGDTAYLVTGDASDFFSSAEYTQKFWKFAKAFVPPVAPSDLSAHVTSDTTITLTWTDNSDFEEGFIITHEVDDPNISTGSGIIRTTVDTLEANVTAYSNQVLEKGYDHIYSITAIHSKGNSEETLLRLLDLTFLNEIDTINATATSVQFTLTSKSNNPAFEVEVSSDSLNFEANTQGGLTFSNLDESSSYYFRVYKVSEGRNPSYRSPYFHTTAKTLLHTPRELSWKNVDEDIQVSWQDISKQESSYSVERSIGNDTSFTVIHIGSANDTLFIDSGTEEGMSYYYRAKAVSEDNTSEYSEVIHAFYYKEPTNLTATNITFNSVTLAWKSQSNEADVTIVERQSYNYDNSEYGEWWPQSRYTGGETHTVTLSQGANVRFRIVATDSAKKYQAYSNTVTVYTPLIALSELSIDEITDNSLQLMWKGDPYIPAKNYRIGIELADESKDFREIATIPGPAYEYWVNDIDMANIYYFRVRKINDYVASTYSNTVDNIIASVSDPQPSKATIKVVPNPAGQWLEVETKETIQQIAITDLSGAEVMSLTPSPEHRYDISGLRAGTYLLIVSSKSGIYKTKLVKQ